MKKILMLSAALAMVATPVFAAGTVTRNYNNTPNADPAGPSGSFNTSATYAIGGNAAVFCRIGNGDAANQASGTNVTITTLNGTASGAITINQFQGADDHANAWQAHLDLASTCNTNFKVVAKSLAGGLKNIFGTSNTQFTNVEDYAINVHFGPDGLGTAVNASAATGSQGAAIIAHAPPTSGDLSLSFTGAADSSKLLLAGIYGDVVTVTMTSVL